MLVICIEAVKELYDSWGKEKKGKKGGGGEDRKEENFRVENVSAFACFASAYAYS